MMFHDFFRQLRSSHDRGTLHEPARRDEAIMIDSCRETPSVPAHSWLGL
jgi:hypothetical protein